MWTRQVPGPDTVALDPTTLLASLAAIIGLGYLGSLLFDATRIPDILLLVAFGVLLGPVTGLLDPGLFRQVAPLVGTFTLLVILFDGGLSLKFNDLFTGFARAGGLAVVGWVLTVGFIGGLLALVYGWDLQLALLLGAILGGSSSIVIIPLMDAAGTEDNVRVTLSVESALTDVLCVVGALAMLEIAVSGELALQAAFGEVASRFSVGIVAGGAAGFAWAHAWRWLERGPYAYMLTLAAILLLHVAVEALGGAGPIAVLAFGVMLGNRPALFQGWVSRAWEEGGQMRAFQEEVTFFVRSFFFVALGILLEPAILGDPRFLVVSGVLLVGVLAGRYAAVELATLGDPELRQERSMLMIMLPRGLAAAVLASLPAQAGLAGTEDFVGYAFAMIVITNVIVTVGMAVLGRKEVDEARPPEPTQAPG